MKFQTAYAAKILASQNIAKPTGWFYQATRAFVNRMIIEQK